MQVIQFHTTKSQLRTRIGPLLLLLYLSSEDYRFEFWKQPLCKVGVRLHTKTNFVNPSKVGSLVEGVLFCKQAKIIKAEGCKLWPLTPKNKTQKLFNPLQIYLKLTELQFRDKQKRSGPTCLLSHYQWLSLEAGMQSSIQAELVQSHIQTDCAVEMYSKVKGKNIIALSRIFLFNF